MKFSAKRADLDQGLKYVLTCSLTGANTEYKDAGKISLKATEKGLESSTHNGYAAMKKVASGGESYIFTEGGETVTIRTNDLMRTLASFPEKEVLNITLEGTELTIRPDSDPEEFQTIPTESGSINLPDVSAQYDKQITIDRNVFLNCMKRVTFAIGFELNRAEFLCWVMRLSSNSIRAVCGDGARFAAYQVEKDNLVQGNLKKGMTIVVHRSHNAILEKLLSASSAENITISEYSRAKDDQIPNQTIITADDLSLILIGHNPGVQWPDENKFLSRKNEYRFTTKVGDLENALLGIGATYNEDVKKATMVHVTNMNFDADKGSIVVQSAHTLKANRKIKLAGGKGKLDFKCQTNYLKDVTRLCNDTDVLQFEFTNPTQPVVVRYFGGAEPTEEPRFLDNLSAGSKEQYTLFFSAFNKKS